MIGKYYINCVLDKCFFINLLMSVLIIKCSSLSHQMAGHSLIRINYFVIADVSVFCCVKLEDLFDIKVQSCIV